VRGEKLSFLGQVPKKFNRTPPPQDLSRRQAIRKCEQLYTEARYFFPFEKCPTEVRCVELFDEVLDECDGSSSAGQWYSSRGMHTIREIREKPEWRNVARQRYLELWRLIREGKQLPKPVIRIFGKGEPHKLKKIRENRTRLIWALDLEFQLLHRTAFGASLAMEQEKHELIPTKDGLSLIRGGTNRFVSDIDDGTDKIGDRDLESWDLSASAWLMRDENEVRKRLCLNPSQFSHDLMDRCLESLLQVEVVFSDGTRLEQVEPGIVKSGSFITLSGNSRMQVLLKILYCDERCGGFVERWHKVAAVGDDSLERMHGVVPADFQQWLTDHGFKCKDFNVGRMSEMTFCSHKFVKHGPVWVPIPTNWLKHQFALSCKPKGNLKYFREQLSSLMLEYAFDDDVFGQLSSTLAKVDPSYSFSQEWAKEFVLGFESKTKGSGRPKVLCVTPRLGWLWFTVLLCLTTCAAQPMPQQPFVAAPVFVPNGFYPDLVLDVFGYFSTLAGIYFMVESLIAGDSQRVSFDTLEYTPQYVNSSLDKERPFGFAQPVFGPISAVPREIGKAALNLSHRWNLNPFKWGQQSQRTKKIEGMTKHKKTGAMSKLGKAKMEAAKARSAAKAASKAAAAIKKTAGPRKARAKRGGGNRLAYLQANRFNMDTARFGGRDLVAKIHLSAAGSMSSSGSDTAGTNLYQTQIRPHLFIPNTRLGKLMRLFMKWRLIKGRFTFKSSLPAGSNAGSLLLVHEPDPNEEIPQPYESPVTNTLSNYDSHSIKAVIPMAKVPDDFKGERADHLDLKPSAAVGPGGGWYVLDPENVATPIENAMGQFAIFVQDAHNVIGASGYLPTEEYEIGSLFFEYDIEVQTASDNGGLSGGYSFYQFVTESTNSYTNLGSETVQAVDYTNARLITTIRPSAGNFYAPDSGSGPENGVQMRVLFNDSGSGSTYFWFPGAGVYLMCFQFQVQHEADVGSIEAHWSGSPVMFGQATLLEADWNDTTTIAATSNSDQLVHLVISITDPVEDYVQLGTCTFGTSTATASSGGSLRVIALPNETTARVRKMLKKKKEEAKTVDDMKGRLESMFETWARAKGMLPAGERKGEDTLRSAVDSVELPSRALLSDADVAAIRGATRAEKDEKKTKRGDSDSDQEWVKPRSRSSKA